MGHYKTIYLYCALPVLLKILNYLLISRINFKSFLSCILNYSSHVMLFKLGSLIKKVSIARLYSTSLKMSTGEKGVSLENVIAALENFAPKALAESWDNTGLLMEPYTARKITRILLTNDLTEDVAQEANSNGCEMIISYHPPIFAPMKSVVKSAWKERIVAYLLENRISLYSPHTSWDCVQGGVNDWLASIFPCDKARPITPGENPNFGAGRILTIQPDNANNIPAMTIADAVDKVKKLTGLEHVRLALGRGRCMANVVNIVAICAGSGASVLKGVQANLYLTGEMLHHDILDATQKGISVILTNHSDSERGFLKQFKPILQEKLKNQVDVIVSKEDRDPLVTV